MTANYSFQEGLIKRVHAARDRGDSGSVLASSCGSGKTFMSIRFVDEVLRKNPDIRVLVLTHGTTVLRSQYARELSEHSPSFSFQSIEKASEINQGTQVVVAIPHAFKKTKPGKFDLIIVDEAHHFYFAENGMVQGIIAHYKPGFQLLLTGSPSRFIRERRFEVISFSMLEALDQGVITDPLVELAETSYNFDLNSYNDAGDLKRGSEISAGETSETLDVLLEKITTIIKSATRTKPEARNLITSAVPERWRVAMGSLGKTMFVCASQNQASFVLEYFKGQGINATSSTSDSDPDSLEIERFKEDDSVQMLIVVDRGILGFNYPKLLNVVDMGASLNVDRLFQLFSRTVRRHPDNKPKLFLKVAPARLSEYTYAVMSFVMALAHPAWYSRFDGDYKQMLIPVPQSFNDWRAKREPKSGKKRTDVTRSTPSVGSEPPPALPRLSTMVSLPHKKGTELSSFAYTTLDEVRRRLSGGNARNDKSLNTLIQNNVARWVEEDYPVLKKWWDSYGFFPRFMRYNRSMEREWGFGITQRALRQIENSDSPIERFILIDHIKTIVGNDMGDDIGRLVDFLSGPNPKTESDLKNIDTLMEISSYRKFVKETGSTPDFFGDRDFYAGGKAHFPKWWLKFLQEFLSEARSNHELGYLQPTIKAKLDEAGVVLNPLDHYFDILVDTLSKIRKERGGLSEESTIRELAKHDFPWEMAKRLEEGKLPKDRLEKLNQALGVDWHLQYNRGEVDVVA